MSEQKEELKPCPFCGGPAEEEEGYAYCPNDCGGLECTPATWNTRAADQETARLRERVAELEGGLRSLSEWAQPASVAGTGDYEQGLLCGLEDRGYQTDGYSAMRYGYDCALERVSEEIDGQISALLSTLNQEAGK